MIGDDATAWFTSRTSGAPEALRRRATQYFARSAPGDLATRLSGAGRAALGAAVRGAGDRSAALDLLAADALITLALLAVAERDPAGFGARAAELRAHAGTVDGGPAGEIAPPAP